MKRLFVLLAVASLVGCASAGDPTLVSGVRRQGGGIYTASALDFGISDPTTAAVKQCAIDKKPLKVVAATTELGMLYGGSYPKLIFRCE